MTDKQANLLGALATALSDQFEAAMSQEVGVGGVAASVLVLIDAEPGITIEDLARVVGVAQPSMTRAVAVLSSVGLVSKVTGSDRRKLVLTVTESGRDRLKRMLGRRAETLEAALAVVDDEDRPAFLRALTAMLEALPVVPEDSFRICRLCDEVSCGTHDECPVERGSRRSVGIQL